MLIEELELEAKNHFACADQVVRSAEAFGRMSKEQEGIIDRHLHDAAECKRKIDAQKKTAYLKTDIGSRRAQIEAMKAKVPHTGIPSFTSPGHQFGTVREALIPKRLSGEYVNAFGDYLESNGTRLSASLQEATSTAGGYAVPVEVDGEIVPLAPTDCALRRLATVRPTTKDVLIPQFATFGTPLSSPVTEGSSFPEDDPTLSQFTLSGFQIGSQRQVSYEIAQDRETFTHEVAELDCGADQLMYEESAYINGSGSGEPLGLIGNVGAGVTEEPDGNGNLVSIAGIDALIGSLKAGYLSNASFLMSRATGIIIRTAQLIGSSGTTAYVPAWTRENGKDYLRGFPVEFSDAMPAAARGNAPVLFGDFKRGYIIGDRGGSALMVKVLDQTLATSGKVLVIAHRRTDGRVLRAEAIQQYNIAAS